MDVATIGATIGSLKAALELTKTLISDYESARIQKPLIELRGIILELQEKVSILRDEYDAAVKSRDELAQKVLEFEHIRKEVIAKYEMIKVGLTGIFVFAPRSETDIAEPTHWLCTKCVHDDRISVLQTQEKNEYRHKLFCPSCKNVYEIKLKELSYLF